MRAKGVLACLALVVLVYALLVFGRVSSALFGERLGYVYHPSTDRLFSLRLRPLILEKAELLNPFSALDFRRADGGEPLGRLEDLLAEQQANSQQIKENSKAWVERAISESRRKLSQIRAGQTPIYYDVEVRPRRDLVASSLLPQSLNFLEPYSRSEPAGVYAGDAVLISWTRQSPMQAELLEGVVVVVDSRAATELYGLVIAP